MKFSDYVRVNSDNETFLTIASSDFTVLHWLAGEVKAAHPDIVEKVSKFPSGQIFGLAYANFKVKLVPITNWLKEILTPKGWGKSSYIRTLVELEKVREGEVLFELWREYEIGV